MIQPIADLIADKAHKNHELKLAFSANPRPRVLCVVCDATLLCVGCLFVCEKGQVTCRCRDQPDSGHVTGARAPLLFRLPTGHPPAPKGGGRVGKWGVGGIKRLKSHYMRILSPLDADPRHFHLIYIFPQPSDIFRYRPLDAHWSTLQVKVGALT